MIKDEYHIQEMSRFFRKMARVERAPLRERQEARKEWLEALDCPPEIARNVLLVLNGIYGYAEQQRALAIIQERENRIAAMSLLLAALDHNCPNAFTRGAFLSLSPEKQIAVNSAIRSAIDEYQQEGEPCQASS